MSDIIEFDAEDFVSTENGGNGFEVENEQVELQEEKSEYSENEAFYDETTGNSFSPEEMSFWKQLQNEGNYLVENGRSEQEVIGLMNGCFYKTVQENDLKEFINGGNDKNDVTQEAWELYEKNVGKMTLKQCVEASDPFIQGMFEDVKPATTRTSRRYSDPFLNGFNDV